MKANLVKNEVENELKVISNTNISVASASKDSEKDHHCFFSPIFENPKGSSFKTNKSNRLKLLIMLLISILLHTIFLWIIKNHTFNSVEDSANSLTSQAYDDSVVFFDNDEPILIPNMNATGSSEGKTSFDADLGKTDDTIYVNDSEESTELAIQTPKNEEVETVDMSEEKHKEVQDQKINPTAALIEVEQEPSAQELRAFALSNLRKPITIEKSKSKKGRNSLITQVDIQKFGQSDGNSNMQVRSSTDLASKSGYQVMEAINKIGKAVLNQICSSSLFRMMRGGHISILMILKTNGQIEKLSVEKSTFGYSQDQEFIKCFKNIFPIFSLPKNMEIDKLNLRFDLYFNSQSCSIGISLI